MDSQTPLELRSEIDSHEIAEPLNAYTARGSFDTEALWTSFTSLKDLTSTRSNSVPQGGIPSSVSPKSASAVSSPTDATSIQSFAFSPTYTAMSSSTSRSSGSVDMTVGPPEQGIDPNMVYKPHASHTVLNGLTPPPTGPSYDKAIAVNIGDKFASQDAFKDACLAFGRTQRETFNGSLSTMPFANNAAIDFCCSCCGVAKFNSSIANRCRWRVRCKKIRAGVEIVALLSPNWQHGIGQSFSKSLSMTSPRKKKPDLAVKALPSQSVKVDKSPPKRKRDALTVGSSAYDDTPPAIGQRFRTLQALLDSKNNYALSAAARGGINYIYEPRSRTKQLPEPSEGKTKFTIGCSESINGVHCACFIEARLGTDTRGDVVWIVSGYELKHSLGCSKATDQVVLTPKRRQRTISLSSGSGSSDSVAKELVNPSKRVKQENHFADVPLSRPYIEIPSMAPASNRDKSVEEVLWWLERRLEKLAPAEDLEALASHLVRQGLTHNYLVTITETEFLKVMRCQLPAQLKPLKRVIKSNTSALRLPELRVEADAIEDVKAACAANRLSLALTLLHPLLGGDRVLAVVQRLGVTCEWLTEPAPGLSTVIDNAAASQREALTALVRIVWRTRMNEYVKMMQEV